VTQILILGGSGYTGRLLALHLLEQSGVDVVLAARNLDRVQTITNQLNSQYAGNRVKSIRIDAADRQNLATTLKGIDLLLVASPTTYYAENVIQAALETGIDYLDVQLGAQKLKLLQSLAPCIQEAGRCFITEAGFHPGLPAVMVRYAATQLQRLDTAIVGAYLNMGKSLPYTEAVDELMELFQDYQAQVFRQGGWTRSSAYETRTIDFGGEIGSRRCISMFFAELQAVPELLPSLREMGFYMSETHWVVDYVLTPLALLGMKIAPHRGVRPLGRLVWWGMQNFPRPPYLVVLKIEARGWKDGQPERLEVHISHPDGYELTAIPVVACLLQYLDGTARRPGLWMMGHLVDPVRLFDDMQRMGIKVAVEWKPGQAALAG
jgi:saccharopine dehydrogenase (NAD+, L-lysine-forming)